MNLFMPIESHTMKKYVNRNALFCHINFGQQSYPVYPEKYVFTHGCLFLGKT